MNYIKSFKSGRTTSRNSNLEATFYGQISVSRGKILLGYSDAELANMGGYDLVHFDDLAYVASAHQECEFDDANKL